MHFTNASGSIMRFDTVSTSCCITKEMTYNTQLNTILYITDLQIPSKPGRPSSEQSSQILLISRLLD
jgi:hypothetical protein